MGFQNITIQGNCTKDAVSRQVADRYVVVFGVAVTEKFKKADGTAGEQTEFFDCEYWSRNASFAQYLTKGASVLVSGKIRTEKWQDQQGGQHEGKKLRADVVQLCGGKPQGQRPAAPVAPVAAPAPQYAPPAPAPTQQPAPQPPQPPMMQPYPKGDSLPPSVPQDPRNFDPEYDSGLPFN